MWSKHPHQALIRNTSEVTQPRKADRRVDEGAKVDLSSFKVAGDQSFNCFSEKLLAKDWIFSNAPVHNLFGLSLDLMIHRRSPLRRIAIRYSKNCV